MSDRLSAARRLETAVASVILGIAVLGMTLLPLTTPVYVRSLVTLVRAEELTGLGPTITLETAETVRRFVLDEDAPPLPAQIAGQPAFDEAASSHLVDVRDVLLPARSVALVAAAIAVAWLVARRRNVRAVAAALRASAWTLLVALGVAALVGLSDFDSFFTWFHGLFFAEGTWTFPPDALLIRVFPLPFWMAAAGTWALLVLMSSALMFTFAYQLRVSQKATVYSHCGA